MITCAVTVVNSPVRHALHLLSHRLEVALHAINADGDRVRQRE
jgi:hypothetical protein